jgi:hypothetical protein
LTPHTYLLDAATTLNDTIFLDALGNPDAVFVIKVNGAFSSNSHAVVMLINGTRARNIFWKVEGAVNLSSYTKFVGTIVCNNGAVGAFATGVSLHGRALTTTGALSTTEVTVVITPGCCTVPLYLQLNGVIQSGVVDCENALQTITVAGNGTTYKILNGGHITMIAGQKIRLLPGTNVYPGGYLHAYITLDGTYCCSLPGNKLAEVAEVVPEQEAGSIFKVYPNPTDGNLYLELDQKYRDVKTEINIFGITGKVVLIKELFGSDSYQFSFTDGSKGIYFIRVIMGDRIETKKIIVN